MTRRPRAVLGVAGFVALFVLALQASAQGGFAVRLSTDTVEVGEAFSLLVRVPVPVASIVHFPDTLARTDFLESHAAVRWQAEPGAEGGAVLTLEYPALAFGVGMVPVPGFDVFVSPADGRSGGTPLPGGSSVGLWSEAPTSGPAAARPLRVPRQSVWANPVFTPEQIDAGVQPMPSADVLGASWHWPTLLVGVALAGVLLGLLASAARAWVVRLRGAGRGPHSHGAWSPEASRQHALEQLARLSADGLATKGRFHELYTRSSSVVRLYVSRLKPGHGQDLTSSELISRLGEAPDSPERERMASEMATAEVVKFGRLRPATASADEHLRSLRAWIEKS